LAEQESKQLGRESALKLDFATHEPRIHVKNNREFSRMAQLTREKTHTLALVALVLAGCAGTPKAVAPPFYGVWVNEDSRLHSWVEIEAHRVVNYGLTQSNGRCVASDIDIVAKDRMVAPVSSLGEGPMSLRLDAGALVIKGNYAIQRYVASSRESICRGPGGAYAPGAPYPK
jgi:hypothetical protein